MKLHVARLLICITWLSLIACGAWAADATVPELIEKLSAGRFAEREAAQQDLVKCGRVALPDLRKHESSNDPELKERVRDTIASILSDPTTIPESFHIVSIDSSLSYQKRKRAVAALYEPWRSNVVVAVSNNPDDERSFTMSNYVQSFVPEINEISAIGIGMSFVGNKSGWVKVEICGNKNNRPTSFVLSRAWVKAPKSNPFKHGGIVVFDVPDIAVDPDATYWIRFVDESRVTNIGLTHNRDHYPAGFAMRGDGGRESDADDMDEDIQFEVFSKSILPPWYREATPKEVRQMKADGHYGSLDEMMKALEKDDLCVAAARQYAIQKVSNGEILAMFDKAAKQGDARAVMWKARLLFKGRASTTADPEKAVKMAKGVVDTVKKLAEEGDTESQFLMGAMYDDALLFKEDMKEAAKWYALAAANDHLTAMENLGLLYALARGVEPDIGKALKLFKRGMALGSKNASRKYSAYFRNYRDDSKKLTAMREVPVGKVLGMTKKEGFDYLVKEKVLTDLKKIKVLKPDPTDCYVFPDDGILIHYDEKADRITGIEGYMNGRRELRQEQFDLKTARAEIPFGLTWADDKAVGPQVLGRNDDGGHVSGDGAYGRAYYINNVNFATMFSYEDDHLVVWRIFEKWAVDYSDPESIKKGSDRNAVHRH